MLKPRPKLRYRSTILYLNVERWNHDIPTPNICQPVGYITLFITLLM